MVMGRPRKQINWEEFDKLCHIQCTLEEIACWYDCSMDTIERAVKREHGVTFAEHWKVKASTGRISLRRSQWQLAMKGDRVMLIWLGKQYLGQQDKRDVQVSGDAEAGIKVIVQDYSAAKAIPEGK